MSKILEQEENFTVLSSNRDFPRSSHFLVTTPYGAGDAIYIGLSALEQFYKNDPDGKIDILCNPLQYELYKYDPRVADVVVAEKSLFPSQEKNTWIYGLKVNPAAAPLARVLKERGYGAIFPGNAAFAFLWKLGAKVLFPSPIGVVKDYLKIRNFGDAPASYRVRSIIDRHFKIKDPEPYPSSPYLFLTEEHMVRGLMLKRRLYPEETVDSKVVIVSADTTSDVTRPPTKLLAQILSICMDLDSSVSVGILPSFSFKDASDDLWGILNERFRGRVAILPSLINDPLLSITALIDQSNLLITGDTGFMHMAAARKIITNKTKDFDLIPGNQTPTIALFGGTNPGLYGYKDRTVIIGRGRSEQRDTRPGFLKEGYVARPIDYFDHIELSEVIPEVVNSLNRYKPGLSKTSAA